MSRLTLLALAVGAIVASAASAALRPHREPTPREAALARILEAADNVDLSDLPPVEGRARVIRAGMDATWSKGESTGQVHATLSWVETDPYAVGICLSDGDRHVHRVTSRDCLVAALAKEPLVLDGTTVAVVDGADDTLVLALVHADRSGYQGFTVPAAEVVNFLGATHALVPLGQERVDWTAEEAALGLDPGSLTDDPGRLA